MDRFADRVQNMIVDALNKISDGDVYRELPPIDSKAGIGPALVLLIETIKNLVREMDMLTRSAMDGKLEVRGNAGAFKGAYSDIIAGVNKTLDALMGPRSVDGFRKSG